MLADATINTNDKPIIQLNCLTIVKGRGLQCLLHQRTNIVIARHTVDRNTKLAEQCPKVLVGARAVILNQVAGYDGDIRLPVTVSIMCEHRGQRAKCHSAAQAAVSGGEEMRVREVQNPKQR